MKKSYEVTIKVEAHAPPKFKRAVEKVVHSLAQEFLPGDAGENMDDEISVIGASVVEVQEHDAVTKKYHVVLRRVVNVIVDNIVAEDARSALDEAVKQFYDTDSKGKHNQFSLNGVPIDDGEEFTAAAVDEYDEEGSYAKELVFDVEKDGLTFKKKPRKG